MKQMEVTEKQLGESTFYIKPVPAFTAVKISGELAAILSPLLGGVAALVGGGSNEEGSSEKPKNIMDVDVEDALPALTSAFSSISGDKFERLTKKLLIDHKNISVVCEATDGEVKLLNYDLANEVFCGDVQDLYILCFEVIRLNFKGFFKKIGAQFGSLKELLQNQAPNTGSGETST